MDPVTGLTRRQLIGLGLLIPIGIVASTIATVVSERVAEPCPDKTWGCATIQAGEHVVLGLLAAEDPSATWPVAETRQALPATLHGRPLHLDVRSPGCSPEEAAEDVRELRSDPPDEPPAVLVVASACDRAAVPMAQLLSDTGTALILLNQVAAIPTSPAFDLVRKDLQLRALPTGPQAIGVVAHLREVVAEHVGAILRSALRAVESVAIADGEKLLIPRTQLRDELMQAGFSPL